MGCIHGHDIQGYGSFHIWFLRIQTGLHTSCQKNGINSWFEVSLWQLQTIFNLNLALSSRIPSGKPKLQGFREKMDKYLD